MNQLIADYFAGTGKDDRGRTLLNVLAQTNEWLERTHDWVQWVFPLDVASRSNALAPVADAETYAFLAQVPAIKATSVIDDAFDRFLAFLEIKPYIAGMAYDIPAQPPSWWHIGNHNHLRITRCLTFLELLNTEHYYYLACVLRLALRTLAIKHPEGVDNEALSFWKVSVFGRHKEDK